MKHRVCVERGTQKQFSSLLPWVGIMNLVCWQRHTFLSNLIDPLSTRNRKEFVNSQHLSGFGLSRWLINTQESRVTKTGQE